MSVVASPSPVAASETESVRVDGSPNPRLPGWVGLRSAIDGLVCLAIAVLMLRSFLVEGYMISTGSMAPALYGYHKRVVCPSCGATFARGTAFDGSTDSAGDELAGGGTQAVCPNCGQSAIDVSHVPRNHGDQLLVLKNAYEIRSPRRWEIVVFRNPNQPTQAFVKRIAGLPGEQIRIVDGDLYADGRICRKSLASQRSIRIPVFDASHSPLDDATWRPRWEAGIGWERRGNAGSTTYHFGTGDAVPPAASETKSKEPEPDEPAPGEPAWLTYRHRYRAGEAPTIAIALERLPLGFVLPAELDGRPVAFQSNIDDPSAGLLTVSGELDDDDVRHLKDLSADPDYRHAIDELAATSRASPIIDAYSYNRSVATTAKAVRDVMIAATVRLAGRGAFAVELADGRDRVRVVVETSSRRIALIRTSTGERLRSAPLPEALLGEGGLLEASMMDRQVLVAVDGRLVFEPWSYDEPDVVAPPTSSPVRIGAAGLNVEIGSLVLYRDVYYTEGTGQNGIESSYKLGANEFFVLGDNSPVSLDSRSWDDGALPERLLLGKPFIVHLPSRPGTIRIGNRERTVRIPDFERIRYIR